ncbi:MAG: ABC transporter ATP-binding protein [Clostridiales bacterium]|nr:ABC transporter ATP-binding protein [Clostridia bacterium]MCR4882134.1 ABC transporter ATP-binding protein [Clostridiales bacterium]
MADSFSNHLSSEEVRTTQQLLEIRHLQIDFAQGKSRTKAASDVSFSVGSGEILCVVGESGSGKSITALSVLGLLNRQGRVSGGEILFEGRDLLKLKEEELDQIRGTGIAMIFQDIMYSLNPVFTIGLQMTEGMCRHRGISRKEAWAEGIHLLERTGIRNAEQVMKKYPHMLSGGMRQRVMIAMALSCRPKLLIADEPTTALDVTIQYQIMELLRSLREETGMSILLITHDLGVVAEMADRVVVMYAGQCVEEAPLAELFQHPAHAYTRSLMRAVPGLHDDRQHKLYSIPGYVPQEYGELKGCRFAPRCPKAEDCPIRDMETWKEIRPGHRTRCWIGGDAENGE